MNKHDKSRKEHRFTFRLSEETWNLIETLANEKGISATAQLMIIIHEWRKANKL